MDERDYNRPMGTVEKYVFTAMCLIFAIGGLVIAGGLIYGIATNLKEFALFLAGLAVFAVIVHVIVKRVNWDA